MPEAKRVIVVGATGEIGRAIRARLLCDPAYALVVLSRDRAAARQKVPGFVLRPFMGDAAAILTSGRRVVPRRLLDLGFQFQYPTLKQALVDLLTR